MNGVVSERTRPLLGKRVGGQRRPRAAGSRQSALRPFEAYIAIVFGELSVLALITIDHSGALVTGGIAIYSVGLVIVYMLLHTTTARLLTIFGVLIGDIHRGVLVNYFSTADYLGIDNLFMRTDRFSMHWYTVGLLLSLLAISVLLRSVSRRDAAPLVGVALLMAYFSFKYVFEIDQYVRVSHYQIILDAVVFTSSAAIACGVRSAEIDIAYVKHQLPLLLYPFLLLIFCDVVTAAGNFAPNVQDARGAYAGLFAGTCTQFGIETAMAVIVVWFLAPRRWSVSSVVAMIFFTYACYRSMTLTAQLLLVAVLLYSFSFPILSERRLSRLWNVGLLILVAGTVAYGSLMGIFNLQSTFFTRIGSVIAPFELWVHSPWLGIGTGFLDTTHITNLAARLFDSGSGSFVRSLNLGIGLGSEIEYRRGQIGGGEMNPHFTPFAIVYCYGLVTLPIVAYYVFRLPARLLWATKAIPEPTIRLTSALALFLVIYSFINASVAPIEIIFSVLVVGSIMRRAGSTMNFIGPQNQRANHKTWIS